MLSLLQVNILELGSKKIVDSANLVIVGQIEVYRLNADLEVYLAAGFVGRQDLEEALGHYTEVGHERR